MILRAAGIFCAVKKPEGQSVVLKDVILSLRAKGIDGEIPGRRIASKVVWLNEKLHNATFEMLKSVIDDWLYQRWWGDNFAGSKGIRADNSKAVA